MGAITGVVRLGELGGVVVAAVAGSVWCRLAVGLPRLIVVAGAGLGDC